jgi:hypothetical protein
MLYEAVTKILPVVLYGCETWSLILREEGKLTVFENGVLRRIFGPKRGEVTGEWRKLHNEELNDLYCSPHTVRGTKPRRTRWTSVLHSANTACCKETHIYGTTII